MECGSKRQNRLLQLHVACRVGEIAPSELKYAKRESPAINSAELQCPSLNTSKPSKSVFGGTADTLRANSNYASNEYFLPVMGLIFLRHAYSRFLMVKEQIEPTLPKRGGVSMPLKKEHCSQKSAIFLRPEAQFDHLVALPDGADRVKAVITAMESIEED